METNQVRIREHTQIPVIKSSRNQSVDSGLVREVRSIAGSFRLIAWVLVIELVFIIGYVIRAEILVHRALRDTENALQEFRSEMEKPPFLGNSKQAGGR